MYLIYVALWGKIKTINCLLFFVITSVSPVLHHPLTKMSTSCLFCLIPYSVNIFNFSWLKMPSCLYRLDITRLNNIQFELAQGLLLWVVNLLTSDCE